MKLRQLRQKAKFTQVQAAEYLQVSLRSYKTYENDDAKKDTLKYRYMVQEMQKLTQIDETHGILRKDEIIQRCEEVFSNYSLTYCYLFGSYAKGKAKENSDIDLLVSSEIKGLQFYGLVENLKNSLQKNVDVLSSVQLLGNQELLDEILKDGIKIYG